MAPIRFGALVDDLSRSLLSTFSSSSISTSTTDQHHHHHHAQQQHLFHPPPLSSSSSPSSSAVLLPLLASLTPESLESTPEIILQPDSTGSSAQVFSLKDSLFLRPFESTSVPGSHNSTQGLFAGPLAGYGFDSSISQSVAGSFAQSEIEIRSHTVVIGSPWFNDNIVLTMIAIILLALIVATIFGNLFVIWAICVERSLRTVGNYLVFSLAITDLLVACLVMPIGAFYVLANEWRLGLWMCELWSFLDVLCCTASIFHLLAIACDRYWAVTTVDYIHRRKPVHVCAAITAIWTVSTVISLGPILGWKDAAFEWRIVKLRQCLVSQSLTYQIFATFASFYAPSAIILFLYFRIYQVAKKRIQLKKQRYRCRIRRRASYYRPRKSICEIGKEVPSIATSATHRPSFNPSSVDEFQTTSSSGFYSSMTTGTSSTGTTQGTTLSLDLKPAQFQQPHQFTSHLGQQTQQQSQSLSPSHSGANHLSPLSLVLNTPEHCASFDSGTSIGGNSSPPVIGSMLGAGPKRLSLEQFFVIQQQQQSIMCEQFVKACNTSTIPSAQNVSPHNLGVDGSLLEKRHSCVMFDSPEQGSRKPRSLSNASMKQPTLQQTSTSSRKNSIFFRKRRESQPGSQAGVVFNAMSAGSPTGVCSPSPNLIVYVDDYTSTVCSSCFYDEDEFEDDDETIDDDEDEDEEDEDDDSVAGNAAGTDIEAKGVTTFDRRKSRVDFMTGIPDIEEEGETNLDESVVVLDDDLTGEDYEIELIIDEDDVVRSLQPPLKPRPSQHVNKSQSTSTISQGSGGSAHPVDRKCSNSAPEIVIIPDQSDQNMSAHTEESSRRPSTVDRLDCLDLSHVPEVEEIGPEMAAGIAAVRRASHCIEGPCVIEIIHNSSTGRRKRSIVLRQGVPTNNAGLLGSSTHSSPRRSSSHSSPNGSGLGSSPLPATLMQLAKNVEAGNSDKKFRKVKKRPKVRIRKLKFRKNDTNEDAGNGNNDASPNNLSANNNNENNGKNGSSKHHANGKNDANGSGAAGGAGHVRRATKHRKHRDARHESKAAKTLTIITGIFIACWAPFFILAVIMPLCRGCVVNKFLFDFSLWLGWANSSVNPLLYTIFRKLEYFGL